jgi:hypothetical protein
MSAERTARRLVRLYPAAWRTRYGSELEELIVASSAGDRVTLRARLDVLANAVRERLRDAALLGDGHAPRERARAGSVVVLWMWACFVVAGAVVQKVAEHWQAGTQPARRATPSAAFAVLELAAAVGSAVLLAGIAMALPSLARLLRAGGWPQIRRGVVRSAALTAASAVATAGLVAWASRLTPGARNVGDVAYELAFVVWACALVACLLSWTAVAGSAARRLELPVRRLRVQALLAGGAALCMAVMTIATLLWWGTTADGATSAFDARLACSAAVMVLATAIAALGARRALAASVELGSGDAQAL